MTNVFIFEITMLLLVVPLHRSKKRLRFQRFSYSVEANELVATTAGRWFGASYCSRSFAVIFFFRPSSLSRVDPIRRRTRRVVPMKNESTLVERVLRGQPTNAKSNFINKLLSDIQFDLVASRGNGGSACRGNCGERTPAVSRREKQKDGMRDVAWPPRRISPKKLVSGSADCSHTIWCPEEE